MSEALHFAEHRLQEVALLIMGLVYTLRLIWLFRHRGARDRQPMNVRQGTSRTRGILYSWLIIAMPWEMESTRKKFFLYVQFVLFHLAVVAAIGLSFVIPYLPWMLDLPGAVPVTQAFIGAGFVVGLLRIIRRVGGKYMRAISSPDDYFSLFLLTTWFLLAFFAIPNRPQEGEGILLAYFWMTAFFLIYVPFSKISHYLYYPFTRYWFGKTMGHRGTFPIRRGAEQGREQARQPAGEKATATTI